MKKEEQDAIWVPELEHFLGIGEGKLIWRLSLKNAGGLLVGAFLAHRLATLLGLHGLPVLGITAVGIAVGVWLTTQHKGLLRLLRLWLLLRLLTRQALGSTTIDASQWVSVPEVAPPRLRVQARVGSSGPVLRTSRTGPRVNAEQVRDGHETVEL